MLAALGVVFTDSKGRSFVPAGGSLGEIAGISFGGLDSRLKELQITVASDVTNPLTGRNGASYVYARQKGADDAMIPVLEDGMRHYAALLEQHFGKTIAEIPGAGAAGGLGAHIWKAAWNCCSACREWRKNWQERIMCLPERAVWMHSLPWGKRLAGLHGWHRRKEFPQLYLQAGSEMGWNRCIR